MHDAARLPWHQHTCRWGQTNLTEIDPVRYDSAWWRQHWRRTRVQGVIVNAGGIVAYYPSQYPLHYRAQHLGGRDLYGDIIKDAREEGLVVLARMDSNRADERFYLEHPDWFTVDIAGKPYRAGERYISCVNSPYYDDYLPMVLREIIARSSPEGITDNSWSGLGRNRICYCHNCASKFREATDYELPRNKDWDSEVYRQWLAWNYRRRVEVWELNNRVTKEAGGPDCLWLGMNAGDITEQAYSFRDTKAICERSDIIMLDAQSRSVAKGFQSNGEAGKLIHGLLGWDKLIPESMAMYQHGKGEPTFRVGSKPEPEVRMWVLEGFAGTIQPWWHHIGSYHEDRRQYRTAEPLFRWHEANEKYLVNRQPVATVGVVWSQENSDYYGRDFAEERVWLPYRGVTQALLRARIAYLPIHADHIDREADKLALLILPNLAAMSEAQCDSVRRFVAKGGGLIATGETSLYDEWGKRRDDFALADLFAAHATHSHHGSLGEESKNWENWAAHSYLRLSPELRAQVDGPQTGAEPAVSGERHGVLQGFEETDILPFGGRLEVVRPEGLSHIPVTLVPPFPIYPPETSWMRHPGSNLSALILQEEKRVAYLAADIDRCFARDHFPDHADLLSNLVRWTSSDRIPLRVEGPGLIDCHLYRQPGRLILHLVNLSGAGAWRAPMHEVIPVGPLKVQVQLLEDIQQPEARLLVRERRVNPSVEDGWVGLELASVLDHEVVVIESPLS